ncbi:stage V sporulation protein T [Lachnospiraceae bacterium LCP25S3_G4]
MKATGIVRRIDDLGRVVIPKEIRRTLRIREGDPLEIFTDREGEVILKKYSPIGELGEFAKQYAESLSQTTGLCVCISDIDRVIAASGSGKRELQDRVISKELENVLEERKQIIAFPEEKKYIKLFSDLVEEIYGQVICPIICEGDVVGSVIILQKDEKKKLNELEMKLAQVAAGFLGKQMEQ